MSLKILVTDTQCALGRALEHDFEREHCQLLAADLNWVDGAIVRETLTRLKPTIVINTRGWSEHALADDLSALPQIVGNLALVCAEMDIPLIHFSSYKVFGVDTKTSHSEKDIPAPVSVAGQTYFAAEQAIEHSGARAIILRLGWVIGSFGDNHLTRLLNSIIHQEPIHLNSRLRGAPTLLWDVARIVVSLVKQIDCGAQTWGILHYCSGDVITEAEFGEQLVQLLAQQQLLAQDVQLSLIDQVPTEDPLSAVLGCRRIRDAFGVQARPWRPSLLPLVKQWFHSQNAKRQ